MRRRIKLEEGTIEFRYLDETIVNIKELYRAKNTQLEIKEIGHLMFKIILWEVK